MTHISILPTRGAAALDYIPELAKLRIEVFREFPYLYDGDMAYEENYLRTYVQSPRSVIVIALDGGTVIGASTALPMADETEEFQRPFLNGTHDPAKIFYFGESVLRKAYRGQGIGVRFFQARETHASEAGDFDCYTFCAVERPADHPLRPADYQPLDGFWRNRGFEKRPDLFSHFSWKDIDADTANTKKMVYWLKRVR